MTLPTLNLLDWLLRPEAAWLRVRADGLLLYAYSLARRTEPSRMVTELSQVD